METTSANPPSVASDTDEKVSKYGWKALAGSTVGYAMDGFDLLILGFMLSAISADLQLRRPRPGRWSPGRWSAPSPAA